MIGLEGYLKDIPDNIIGKILKNVELEKYFWDLTYADPALLLGNAYGYFQTNGIEKFIKVCEKEQISELILKGYTSPDFVDVQNGRDFVNSNCALVLIICDVSWIEVYFKEDLAQKIITNFDNLNIKYKIKTLENDGRYIFELY